MKPLDRLTQFWTFRIGIIAAAAMWFLTPSLSERRIGLPTLVATIIGVPPVTVIAAEGDRTAIRPFTFTAPEKDLVELRRRVQRDRVARARDRLRRIAGRAARDDAGTRALLGDRYDWRKVEAKLNALPQFITEIDGLDIHFIHVRSKHANALPLVVTHGWPGSVIEQLKIIDPLVNPTAHGGERIGRIRRRDSVHARLRLFRQAHHAPAGAPSAWAAPGTS